LCEEETKEQRHQLRKRGGERGEINRDGERERERRRGPHSYE
jgi:hypothetical protein